MGAAFLVDGHTEQRFIQKICPNKTVQRINLNGSSVGAIAIAKRVATQVRLWGGRYFPIIIVVDLEDRLITPTAFSGSLLMAIRNEGIADEIVIGVASRMIENWILADSQRLNWTTCPSQVDSFHGAAKLKEIIGDYDKASDGPELLHQARPSKIREKSPSFDDFMNALPIMPGCHWLSR